MTMNIRIVTQCKYLDNGKPVTHITHDFVRDDGTIIKKYSTPTVITNDFTEDELEDIFCMIINPLSENSQRTC